MTESRTYFIWSHEHRAWWGPDRTGYTRELDKAGLYTRAAAIEICINARGGWHPGEPPPEIPVFHYDAIEVETTFRATTETA